MKLWQKRLIWIGHWLFAILIICVLVSMVVFGLSAPRWIGALYMLLLGSATLIEHVAKHPFGTFRYNRFTTPRGLTAMKWFWRIGFLGPVFLLFIALMGLPALSDSASAALADPPSPVVISLLVVLAAGMVSYFGYGMSLYPVDGVNIFRWPRQDPSLPPHNGAPHAS